MLQRGQGSNPEAGEALQWEKQGFQKAKGEVTLGSHQMVPRPCQYGNFSANKHCKVNSALLPPLIIKPNSCALGLSCCMWRNPLPAAPALNLASAAESSSQLFSEPCSKPLASPPTSFPKSLWVSWQKQWQALAQLPNTRPGLSLPSSFP